MSVVLRFRNTLRAVDPVRFLPGSWNLIALLAGVMVFAHGTSAFAEEPASIRNQSDPAIPSAEAMALAQIIKANQFASIRIFPVEEEAKRFKRDLFYFSSAKFNFQKPCDQDNEKCQYIATKIADEAAAQMVEQRQALINSLYASSFDMHMSKAEIQQAYEFAKTDAGSLFLDAIFVDMIDPKFRSLITDKLPSIGAETRNIRDSYFSRFYSETEGLPRSKLKMPRPPQPFTPPKGGNK